MRVGELANASGLSVKTIHFYEARGLLPTPPRTPGGYRDYPTQTTARLAFIRDAQAAGLSLAEIADVLAIRDAGQPPCQHVSALIESHLTRIRARIDELHATETVLRRLARRAADTDPAACTDRDICRVLSGT